MNLERTDDTAYRGLFDRFASLGITAKVMTSPEHATVEEGKALRGQMSGTFTKNLLLKGRRGAIFCWPSTKIKRLT